MKFAISGPQCTGKSTLLEELKQIPHLRDNYIFKGNITRGIKELGIDINEAGSDVSQILIMAKHLEHSIYPNVILDRCSLDGEIYTRYLRQHGKCSGGALSFAWDIRNRTIQLYDTIFITKPEFELVDDGTRSVDREFQNWINEVFIAEAKFISDTNQTEIVNLTGSLSERVDTVLNHILEKEKVNK